MKTAEKVRDQLEDILKSVLLEMEQTKIKGKTMLEILNINIKEINERILEPPVLQYQLIRSLILGFNGPIVEKTAPQVCLLLKNLI